MGEEDPLNRAKRLLTKHYNENYILKPDDYISQSDFRVVWAAGSVNEYSVVLVSPYFHLDETRFEMFYSFKEQTMTITAYKQVTQEVIESV